MGTGRSGADDTTWVAVAAALSVAAVGETLVRLAGPSVTDPYLLFVCLLGLATTAPLALRDPGAAAVPVTVAALVSLAGFDLLTVAGMTAQALVVYRAGRHGWPPLALVAGACYVVPALVDRGTVAVLLAGVVPLAAGAGIARRVRRETAEHAAARDAFAGTLLENTARGERARIARELHDVVAHHVSMISVQAETARLTTPGLPPAGAQRLSAIGDTARAALTEMRRLLGVLRSDTGDAAERRPQPGLGQLYELLDEARDASGAGTRLIIHGTPATLDPGVELAAYRIVQEALTNARRHAPGAAVDVELHFSGPSLRLLVRDNGPGSAASTDSGGHGLLGMRERAAAVGGTLRAGAGTAGGFLVEATLPTNAEDTR
ncbi:hypothetical protein GCM10009682_55290 [Luedemannella flava]|uniref:histidine kinase n=1 Tax=Luedemannella flava TaxID=349316 RepID=A0ABN2MJT1_9ACTN